MACVRLEPDLANVSASRRWLRGVLEEHGIQGDAAYDALLVATELVTNAVQHGRTELVLDASLEGHDLCVAVEDGNPREPVALPPSDLATNGRGIALVQQLSRRWGTEQTPDGKRVWAVLPLLVDA